MFIVKLIFIILPFFYFASVNATPLSLNEFLNQVRAANPSIEAAKLRALALKHRIRPSATWDDPFIAAGIDEKPFDGGEGEVRRYQISQTIPFPGKIGAREDIAEKLAQASEYDAITRSRQVEVIATQAYLQAGYNSQAIRLNQNIQKIIQDTTASAKVRYKTGDSTHHEWLLAKIELSILKVEALRLERTRTALMALLNELRNLPSETPLETDHSGPLKLEIDPSKIVTNLTEQPELKSWDFQKKIAASELKLVKLSYAPDFVIQGMAMEPTMRDSQMKSNWGVMIGVTVPLFFWRKQSELVMAAEKDRLASISEYQNLQNRLNTELTDAKQQLKTSVDVVKLYKNDVIPLTEIAVRNAQSGYAAKTLPLGQFLEALKSQKTQELELLAAQYDVVVAKTRIEELLSSPPVTRFAPSRPTLFGSGNMEQMSGAGGMDSSPTINMGQGMSGPTRKTAPSGDQSSSSGMGGM